MPCLNCWVSLSIAFPSASALHLSKTNSTLSQYLLSLLILIMIIRCFFRRRCIRHRIKNICVGNSPMKRFLVFDDFSDELCRKVAVTPSVPLLPGNLGTGKPWHVTTICRHIKHLCVFGLNGKKREGKQNWNYKLRKIKKLIYILSEWKRKNNCLAKIIKKYFCIK